MPTQSVNTAFPRLHMVDALRGIALVAMIVFHASWNLDVFGFAQLGVMSTPGWIWFARIIAGSFLFLTGLSLMLAEFASQDAKPRLFRIAKIASAAILVSVATYIVFPDSFVYFGILHHIALASLLAWPLLRFNAAAIAVIAIAIVLTNSLFEFQFADTRWLAWIGVSQEVPATNDYVPLLPWFSLVFLGVIAGKQVIKRNDVKRILASRPSWSKPLIWMGRHSLLIYLLHQPILFGIAYGAFTLSR